jgi:hypothetical protein
VLCRQLERELNAANERIAKLEAELESNAFSLTPAMVQARNDQLNDRIKRLEEAGDKIAAALEQEWPTAADIEARVDDRHAAKQS